MPESIVTPIVLIDEHRVVAWGALQMPARAIDGNGVAIDRGDRLDGDHHVRGTEAEEPAALDTQETHLVLGVVDHQAIDGADVLPRIVQDFPVPSCIVRTLSSRCAEIRDRP